MIVLTRGHLSAEFFEGTATNNLRAAIREMAPDLPRGGRGRRGILANMESDGLEVSADEFRRAMWVLVDGSLTGTYHRMELSAGELRARDASGMLDTAYQVTRATYGSRSEIETGNPLDARISQTDEHGTSLEILHLGEAEAETPDHEKDETKVIEDRSYKFKAYLVAVVPVISKVCVTSNLPRASIITRPIHRGVTPKAQLDTLHQWLEGELRCPLPSVAGIKEGIKQLFLDRRLVPHQLDVQGGDRTRIAYKRTKGALNTSSQAAEEIIKAWDADTGSLLLDDQYSFRVDTGRAIFSFGRNTSLQESDYVIQTVLGAAV